MPMLGLKLEVGPLRLGDTGWVGKRLGNGWRWEGDRDDWALEGGWSKRIWMSPSDWGLRWRTSLLVLSKSFPQNQ